MGRRDSGFMLVLVIAVIVLLAGLGVLAMNFAQYAARQGQQEAAGAYARQLVASGLAWGETHREELAGTGGWRELGAEEVVGTAGSGSVRVRLVGDEVATEARVEVGRVHVRCRGGGAGEN